MNIFSLADDQLQSAIFERKLTHEPEIVQACFYGDTDKVRSILFKQKDEIHTLDSDRRSPLHAAAFNGEHEIVNLLLLSGARANLKDVRWLTPLHRSCRSGSTETVRTLLNHSGDVCARDKNWQTPLHVAAANNAIGCAELLIPLLTNMNVADRTGKTPLHHASINGHAEMATLLLSKNANVNTPDRADRRSLHWAALMGHSEVVKILLAQGADKSCKDKKGNTPLHFAAAGGHVGSLLLLIDAGCEVNVHNVNGDTPLHFACVNHHTQAVNELLMNHADAHLKNSRGYSCLHYVSPYVGSSDIIERLILEDCDPTAASRNGQTPLHLAAYAGRLDHCIIFLKNGCSVNVVDQDGNTPLHLAAYAGHCEVMSLLIDNGADYKTPGQQGMSALHLAASFGHVDCCKLLVSKTLIDTRMDFNIETLDSEDRSCLHLAALSGNVKCVELLWKSGCDANLKDREGRTALHYAAHLPNLGCVETLVQAGAAVNQQDSRNGSALHYASVADSEGSVVDYLLRNDARITMLDDQGFTPIHYAALRGQRNVLELLLKNASKDLILKLEESGTLTPLHLAAYHGHEDVLSLLMEHCINLNVLDTSGRTPLDLACFRGFSHCAESLLLQGASVLSHDVVNHRTPFHSAAANGHSSCLALLIKNSEDPTFVDSTDKFGRTALMHAAVNGYLDCVLLLLNSGASVNLADMHKRTALHRAAALGYDEICAPLLKAGADTNFRDIKGRMAIHLAASAGHATLVHLFSAYITPDESLADEDGYSPLHWAAYNGYESCIDILLQSDLSSSPRDMSASGDSPKARSLFSKYFVSGTTTPLHCAVSQENESCTEMFMEQFGPEILDIPDAKGRLPIHAAAYNDCYDSLRLLMSHPSSANSINAKDDSGETPLMLAMQAGKLASVQLLIDNETASLLPVDADGNTGLHLACMRGHAACCLAVLDAHPEAAAAAAMQNHADQTPLHLAARNALVSVVQELVNKGASVTAIDSNGYTPALACCPSQEAADCLQIILQAMFPSNVNDSCEEDEARSETNSIDSESFY